MCDAVTTLANLTDFGRGGIKGGGKEQENLENKEEFCMNLVAPSWDLQPFKKN